MERYRLIPVEGLPRFHGGGVGYLAYDCIRYFRTQGARPCQPIRRACPSRCSCSPTPCWSFDHLRHDIKVVSHVQAGRQHRPGLSGGQGKNRRTGGPPVPAAGTAPGHAGAATDSRRAGAAVESNFTQPLYEEAVEKCVEYIYDGDVIQVVNSQRFFPQDRRRPISRYIGRCGASTRRPICTTCTWTTSTS